jgi:hypothetical protein
MENRRDPRARMPPNDPLDDPVVYNDRSGIAFTTKRIESK